MESASSIAQAFSSQLVPVAQSSARQLLRIAQQRAYLTVIGTNGEEVPFAHARLLLRFERLWSGVGGLVHDMRLDETFTSLAEEKPGHPRSTPGRRLRSSDIYMTGHLGNDAAHQISAGAMMLATMMLLTKLLLRRSARR